MVLKEMRNRRKWAVVGTVVAVAILVSVGLWMSEDGWGYSWKTPASRSMAQIASACGFEKWARKLYRNYMESHLNDLQAGVQSGRLVVLRFRQPENPNFRWMTRRIGRYAREHGIPVSAMNREKGDWFRVYVESDRSARMKKFINQLTEGERF